MKKNLLKTMTLIVVLAMILVYALLGSEGLSRFIGDNLIYKDNILITISTVNMVFIWGLPVGLLILIGVYFMVNRHSSGAKIVPVYSGLIGLEQEEKVKAGKAYNITFGLLILINILGFIYFINDYTVVFEDKIEKHSILKFENTAYKYEDIKDISVGVWPTRHGILYYKVNFKDGENINIASNNVSNNNNSLDGLVKVNRIIKENDIERNIDKKHFYKIVDGLGEDYVKQYEELFKE